MQWHFLRQVAKYIDMKQQGHVEVEHNSKPPVFEDLFKMLYDKGRF